jgi:hypothetical protein
LSVECYTGGGTVLKRGGVVAASEKVTARRRRARALPAGESAIEAEARASAPAKGKVLTAFRIPRHLHATMTHESRAQGIDLTAYVNRLFDGFLHDFGLPSVIRENLDRDREALGLSRYDYLQYVLYRRHEAVMEKGAAFDRSPTRRK